MEIRRAGTRGHFDFGWLNTFHSFSFGDYHDPERMGFRSLRVLNEDWVQPGQGFGMHPHRDMEIFTWILEGRLEHRDSLGSHGLIEPGEAQVMSAGTGILHSEFNPSPTEPVHLLQIWILPERRGLTPRYGQTPFPPERLRDRWALLFSPDGAEGSVQIFQDARLWANRPSAGSLVTQPAPASQHAFIHLARGRFQQGETILEAGDAVLLEPGEPWEIQVVEDGEILFFDLA